MLLLLLLLPATVAAEDFSHFPCEMRWYLCTVYALNLVHAYIYIHSFTQLLIQSFIHSIALYFWILIFQMEKPNPSSSHWFNTDTRTHFISNKKFLSKLSFITTLSLYLSYSFPFCLSFFGCRTFYLYIVVAVIFVYLWQCLTIPGADKRKCSIFQFFIHRATIGDFLTHSSSYFATLSFVLLSFSIRLSVAECLSVYVWMCLFYWSSLFGVVDVIIFIFSISKYLSAMMRNL